MGKTVTIEFDNEKAAEHFLSWMSESGEQDYWMWMESIEHEDPQFGITAITFDYHNLNGNAFGPRVKAECDRLDRL